MKRSPEEIRLFNKMNASLPKELTIVPRSEWPDVPNPPNQLWRSRDFVVQIFIGPHAIRLTVNSTQAKETGGWEEGIQWTELQQIKKDVGYGERTAVEIYPKDSEIMNVANMRHLWIHKEELTFGWKRG